MVLAILKWVIFPKKQTNVSKRKYRQVYEDAAKEESFIYNGVEIPRRFGDLIVWKEILEFAKAHDRDVFFVTDDAKEDWWWREKGQRIGPRPELVQEMHNQSGRLFEISSSASFLRDSNQYLKTKFDKKTQEYVRDVNAKLAKRTMVRSWSQDIQSELAERDLVNRLREAQVNRSLEEAAIEFPVRRKRHYSMGPTPLNGPFDQLIVDDYNSRLIGVEAVRMRSPSMLKIVEKLEHFNTLQEKEGVDASLLLIIVSPDPDNYSKIEYISKAMMNRMLPETSVVFVQFGGNPEFNEDFLLLKEISKTAG